MENTKTKKTADYIRGQKGKEKLAMLTAYDYPSARILDEEGVDMILVGDSVGMVLLGHKTTRPVTLDDILHHAKAVSKGVKNSFFIVDMPYETYEDEERALQNARAILRETRADAVKLEGGAQIQEQIESLINDSIQVVGHLGMLPQSAASMSDYRVHGKDDAEAEKIFSDALFLDELGVVAIVLECIPAELAKRITSAVKCPTIGIGAGAETDGQVLVLHDMLGFGGEVQPKFVRRYASLEEEMRKAVTAYQSDVRSKNYPSKEESY